MKAQTDFSNSEDTDRLSVRRSVLVWVFGAVLGWMIAVVAVYSLIRDTEDQPPALKAQQQRR